MFGLGARAHSPYAYDQGDNVIGRLSLITDGSGSTRFDYDTFGRVALETRTIDGIAYTTAYHYDAFGRSTGLTYPSGRRIEYGYDQLTGSRVRSGDRTQADL